MPKVWYFGVYIGLPLETTNCSYLSMYCARPGQATYDLGFGASVGLISSTVLAPNMEFIGS